MLFFHSSFQNRIYRLTPNKNSIKHGSALPKPLGAHRNGINIKQRGSKSARFSLSKSCGSQCQVDTDRNDGWLSSINKVLSLSEQMFGHHFLDTLPPLSESAGFYFNFYTGKRNKLSGTKGRMNKVLTSVPISCFFLSAQWDRHLLADSRENVP